MQLFLRVSQYYILRGNVPFPRAGHIYSTHTKLQDVQTRLERGGGGGGGGTEGEQREGGRNYISMYKCMNTP